MQKVKYLAFMCLSLLVSFGTLAQNGKFNELVWSDEFNGNGAIDPQWWGFDLGTGDNGWGNRELQTYTNQQANVRQSNGNLIIEALKQNGSWTSARVKTQGKFNFTYGRVEFRAKLAPGVGTWPALWMLGESITTKGWPACGEVDVMEYIDRLPGKVQAALHTPSSYGNTQNVGSTQVPDATTAFHVYAAEWTDKDIKFYVDNTLYYTYAPAVRDARTWPFTEDQFLIMNIAVGGNMGSEPTLETNGQKNGVDPSLTNTRMEVDYVRVYQQFQDLKLTGPTLVKPLAQNLTFKASRLANATYTWTLPAGATVVDGHNSPEVIINWGSNSGQVKVEMQHNGQTYSKTMEVKTKAVPSGSSYLIEGFSPFPADRLTPTGGTFDMSQAQDALRIKYNITAPANLPNIVYTLENPLDMTEYPVLAAAVKTLNRSKTVALRLDLLDAAGNLTGGNQVFTLSPLIDDGEFYTYYFDFKEAFGTGAGKVDPASINKIRILINYGLFGKPGQDSLWLDHLSVLKAIPATPNRASHAAASMAASGVKIDWQDRSGNEEGFKVFRSSQFKGTYVEIAALPANAITFTDVAGTRESFYKVQSYNAAGVSDYSNSATVAGVLSAAQEEWLERQFLVYPNPAQQKFTVSYPAQYKVKSLRLFSTTGQEVPLLVSFQKVAKNTAEVQPAVALAEGLYFCHIQTEDALLVKRIFLQRLP
ncbi:glycosyl hydrolase family protein [Rufibacter immobilis]|uniref:Glycosyl hydrolase family protein n=1 Tax=Rufibacter immobilis TaxID=1348778 RepID=A0A3M9MW46_9BACT|nr:family 16 glycosylhydrolase [Rufibacter immobilis]RNI29749.1 glycosyl hydrolase family protein [Rufibacter immobilis]